MNLFGPVGKKDYSNYLRFLDQCFQKKEKFWFEKHMGHIFKRSDPPRHHYILKSNSDILGSFGMYPARLIVKGIPIKTARIGSVAVGSQYQGRGLLTEMVERAREVMRQKNIMLSWLWGDPHLYGRYGWFPGGKISQMSVGFKALENHAGPGNIKIKIAGPGDISSLNRLYHSHKSGVKRTPGTWEEHLKRKNFQVVVAEGQGRKKAYAIYMPENPGTIFEMGGNSGCLLAILKKHARKFAFKKLMLEFPEGQKDSLPDLGFPNKISSRACEQISVLNPGGVARLFELNNPTPKSVQKWIQKENWWISRLDYV